MVPMRRAAADILEPARRSVGNVRFSDLRRPVEAIGYRLRRRAGSHHVYTHAARPDLPMINLQDDKGKAKAYQVRQVVRLIDEHKLEVKP